MRISRIFTEASLQPQQLLTLDEKASHYLGRVLRVKVGSPLILFNGNGSQYNSTIHTIEKKHITAQIDSCQPVNNESPLTTRLGIAISKGDRMDWVIQKATELGVTEITPLTSERSEVKLKADRLEKKLQHWQQIIISTCEQCGRNRLPQLHPLRDIESWANTTCADKKFVLHHRTENRLNSADNVSSAALLIGPEGGLSDREIVMAEASGFDALQLGPRVLRTETAPLAAIAVLQATWGDF